jgi:hypothetical protein
VPGFDVSKDVVIDIMHGLATVSKGLIHVAKGQRQPDADDVDEAYVHMCIHEREVIMDVQEGSTSPRT